MHASSTHARQTSSGKTVRLVAESSVEWGRLASALRLRAARCTSPGVWPVRRAESITAGPITAGPITAGVRLWGGQSVAQQTEGSSQVHTHKCVCRLELSVGGPGNEVQVASLQPGPLGHTHSPLHFSSQKGWSSLSLLGWGSVGEKGTVGGLHIPAFLTFLWWSSVAWPPSPLKVTALYDFSPSGFTESAGPTWAAGLLMHRRKGVSVVTVLGCSAFLIHRGL